MRHDAGWVLGLTAIAVVVVSGCDGVRSDNRENALAYSNRGAAKFNKSDLDGAIADYTRAIELDPKLALAYSNRGNAKQAKGDLDGAIADLTKVIELDPQSVDAYNSRSILRKSKGDIDGAAADSRRAAELKK